MRRAFLLLGWLVATSGFSAAGHVPDFWARVHEQNAEAELRRIVGAELRFKNARAIAVQRLPKAWIAAVQKEKDGTYSVQLISESGASALGRLEELLSCLAVCPDTNEKDEDLVVEFASGELSLVTEVENREQLVTVPIRREEVRLTVELMIIPAHKEPNQ